MIKKPLIINGVQRILVVDENQKVANVLREQLLLTGCKIGCGEGHCGACTVHLRGRAMRSCQVQVSVAANSPIVTIEGLSAEGTHPVQQAWKALDVPECGYCQAGQIMSAAALLATTPKPTDAQIDAAMNGNICRCGTYARIRAGIHRAASGK